MTSTPMTANDIAAILLDRPRFERLSKYMQSQRPDDIWYGIDCTRRYVIGRFIFFYLAEDYLELIDKLNEAERNPWPNGRKA